MKTCRLCNITLSLEMYSAHKTSADGLRTICRTCSAKQIKEWRNANAEKVREYNQSYGAEWRAANQDLVKAYHQQTKDARNAESRAYYAANREKAREANRQWHLDNPDARRIRQRNRVARLKGAEGQFTKDDIARIFGLQKGKCAYCRVKLTKKHHVDHIRPIAKGGTNWPRNLQLTCSACNQSKKDRLPEVHAKIMGLLI